MLRIRLRINIPTDWPDETDSAATLTPTLKFLRESGYVPAQTRKNNRRSVNIVRGLAAAVFSYPFQIGFSVLSSPSRPYPADGFPSGARLPSENRSLGDSLNTPTARDLPGAGRLIGETLPGRFLATHRSSLAAGQVLFFGPDFVDFQRRQPTTTWTFSLKNVVIWLIALVSKWVKKKNEYDKLQKVYFIDLFVKILTYMFAQGVHTDREKTDATWNVTSLLVYAFTVIISRISHLSSTTTINVY